MSREAAGDYEADSSSDDESAGSEDENEISISLEPMTGEDYRPCLDIVHNGRRTGGTVRIALSPVMEDLVSDFFSALETCKKWDRSIESKKNDRKKKGTYSQQR